MKVLRATPSLLHGIAIAFVLSAVGGALSFALSLLLGAQPALRILVPLLGGAYVLYLLSRSHERIGRVTTVLAWTLGCAAAWFAHPPLAPYLLIHVGMLWLIRSLYFYSGVLPALADLALSLIALAFGVWAASRSGGVFLGSWSFFLVQAFFVLIPASVRDGARRGSAPAAGPEPCAFTLAQRTADAALRRLAAGR